MAEKRTDLPGQAVRVTDHLCHGTGYGIIIGSLVELNVVPTSEQDVLLVDLANQPDILQAEALPVVLAGQRQ